MERGEQIGIKKIAKNMILQNIPIKQISIVTGLTEKEILSLK